MKDNNQQSIGSQIDGCFQPNSFAEILPYADALNRMRELYKESGQSNLILIQSFSDGYKATFNIKDNYLIGEGDTAESALIDLMGATAAELVQVLYLLESDPDLVVIDGFEAVRGEHAR